MFWAAVTKSPAKVKHPAAATQCTIAHTVHNRVHLNATETMHALTFHNAPVLHPSLLPPSACPAAGSNLGPVEDGLDVQDVGDVPRELGKAAQGRRVRPHERSHLVRQATLLHTKRDSLLERVEERLKGRGVR